MFESGFGMFELYLNTVLRCFLGYLVFTLLLGTVEWECLVAGLEGGIP